MDTTTLIVVAIHEVLPQAYHILYDYYNNSSNTDNIVRQNIGYSMSMKKKQRIYLKACSPEENKYHLIFNNVLSSDSDLLCTNTHKGCCMLNANE